MLRLLDDSDHLADLIHESPALEAIKSVDVDPDDSKKTVSYRYELHGQRGTETLSRKRIQNLVSGLNATARRKTPSPARS